MYLHNKNNMRHFCITNKKKQKRLAFFADKTELRTPPAKHNKIVIKGKFCIKSITNPPSSQAWRFHQYPMYDIFDRAELLEIALMRSHLQTQQFLLKQVHSVQG